MKPHYLYHASVNKDIDQLEPHAQSIRNTQEGPVIFATEDKKAATVFLVPTTDSWTNSGMFSNEKGIEFRYMVISDEKRYRKLDKGGAIYTLPSTSFFIDTRFDPKEREWVSKNPVKPAAKDVYDSGLVAMMHAGIQVYFVDDKKFQNIKSAPDHGYSILRNSISENQKLGIYSLS